MGIQSLMETITRIAQQTVALEIIQTMERYGLLRITFLGKVLKEI